MLRLALLLLAGATAHRCIHDSHERALQSHATSNYTRRALVAVDHGQAYDAVPDGRR
jgi:hypothetical protein